MVGEMTEAFSRAGKIVLGPRSKAGAVLSADNLARLHRIFGDAFDVLADHYGLDGEAPMVGPEVDEPEPAKEARPAIAKRLFGATLFPWKSDLLI
jgi:hypothetical protein